ncbi:MAG: hypothetical protein GY884_32925 [Proteobacteria bacterium]|nr:hypothetical protein [Pseudomonadota bacterium]
MTLLALIWSLFVGVVHADDTVAVLYFENRGNPDLEPLKVGLAQMLITDLTGAPGVQVVERAQLQAILDELELGHSGAVDPNSAAKVGKLLGAEWMLMGSYFEMAGTLRIDARLVNVETGAIEHAAGQNGTAMDFMSMEKALADDFRSELTKQGRSTRDEAGEGTAVAAVVETTAPLLAEPDPEALEAAVAFSEGLIFMDGKDAPRAREAFQKAIDADPNLKPAQDALAALDL